MFYESTGNEEDIDMLLFTSGPATANEVLDLAMPNYVTGTNVAGFPINMGISSIKTSGGLGQPGRLLVFDAHGGYNSDGIFIYNNDSIFIYLAVCL